ncbi:MAG: HEAT repeat domain-containing protein, partial [Nanoarchaeota archaeon]|nr:HEAT repeat domain-containing protein [Nanoarchaeota archaeon]
MKFEKLLSFVLVFILVVSSVNGLCMTSVSKEVYKQKLIDEGLERPTDNQIYAAWYYENNKEDFDRQGLSREQAVNIIERVREQELEEVVDEEKVAVEITPEIEQWYNGLGEGFLRANFPTLDEGQLKALVDSDDRVQTLRDLDFSDNEILIRMGGKGVSVDDKDSKAVIALIQALKEEDSGVRRNAAEALGEIKDPTAVPALIQALKDENSAVRRNAAEALGEIKDSTAVPALIQALKDEDWIVEICVAKALEEIKDPTAVPVLIQLLKDDESHVRSYAAETLGEIKDSTAVPALIQALKDEESYVRGYAAKALGNIKDPKAVPALIQALGDENWRVRENIVKALGEIGEPAVPALIQILGDENWRVRENIVKALGRTKDPTAVPALIQALEDEESHVRRYVAKALGRTKDPTAVPALIQALEDENPFVKKYAAEALVEIGKPAVPQLIQALKDEESHVRRYVAKALGEIGEPAVPALIQALKDEDSDVRIYAAKALVEMGEPAVPALIQALKDEESDVRLNVARALGEIKDQTAVPALIQALKDENWHVRMNAAGALGKIKDQTAVPALIQALKDEDPGVRVDAAEALVKIGEPAVPALIQALKDEESDVRGGAAKALVEIGEPAVPALIQALKDENSNVRRNVAEALGKIKDQTAVPELIQALKDENWHVRRNAAGALGKIKDSTAVPALIQALKDENSAVRTYAAGALGEIGEPAVPALIQALKDEDSDVKESAGEALVEIGKPAVPALIQALKDENSDVRRTVVNSLAKIGDESAIEPLIEMLTDPFIVKDVMCDVLNLASKNPEHELGQFYASLPDELHPILKLPIVALHARGISKNNEIFMQNVIQNMFIADSRISREIVSELVSFNSKEKGWLFVYDFLLSKIEKNDRLDFIEKGRKIKSNAKKLQIIEALTKSLKFNEGRKVLFDSITNSNFFSLVPVMLNLIDSGYLSLEESVNVLKSEDPEKLFAESMKYKILQMYDIGGDEVHNDFAHALDNSDFIVDAVTLVLTYQDNANALKRLKELMNAFVKGGKEGLWKEKFKNSKEQIPDELYETLFNARELSETVTIRDRSDIYAEYFSTVISSMHQHKSQIGKEVEEKDIESGIVEKIKYLAERIDNDEVKHTVSDITLDNVEEKKKDLEKILSSSKEKSIKNILPGVIAQLTILEKIPGYYSTIKQSEDIAQRIENLNGLVEKDMLSELESIKSEFDIGSLSNKILDLQKATSKSEAREYYGDFIALLNNVLRARVNSEVTTATAKVITSLEDALHVGYYGPGGSSEGNCQKCDRASSYSQALMGFIGDSSQLLIGLYDSNNKMIGFKTAHGLYDSDNNFVMVFNEDKLYTQDVESTTAQNFAAKRLMQKLQSKGIKVYKNGDKQIKLSAPKSNLLYYVDALGVIHTDDINEYNVERLETISESMASGKLEGVEFISGVEDKPQTLTESVSTIPTITPEIEQWYNGLGEGFLRANFPTLTEVQMKVLIGSDDRVQTLRDLDFSDNEILIRMGGKRVDVEGEVSVDVAKRVKELDSILEDTVFKNILDRLRLIDRDQQKWDAIEELAEIGHVAAPILVKHFDYNEINSLRMLKQIENLASGAVPEIIEHIKNKDNDRYGRLKLLKLLNELEDERSLDLLVSIIKDTQEPSQMKRIAIEGLGGIDSDRARAELGELLSTLTSDQVLTGEYPVMRALSKHGKKSTPYLLDALNSPEKYVQTGAAIILGDIKESKAVDSLIKIVESNEDEYIRHIAMAALGNIKDKKAVQILSQFANEGSINAMYALMKINDVDAIINLNVENKNDMLYQLGNLQKVKDEGLTELVKDIENQQIRNENLDSEYSKYPDLIRALKAETKLEGVKKDDNIVAWYTKGGVNTFLVKDEKGLEYILKTPNEYKKDFELDHEYNMLKTIQEEMPEEYKRFFPRPAKLIYDYSQGKIAGILLEYFADTITLKEAGTVSPEFYSKLDEIVREMGEKGIRNNDLHNEQVLVKGNEPRLIDFGRAIIHPDPISDYKNDNLRNVRLWEAVYYNSQIKYDDFSFINDLLNAGEITKEEFIAINKGEMKMPTNSKGQTYSEIIEKIKELESVFEDSTFKKIMGITGIINIEQQKKNAVNELGTLGNYGIEPLEKIIAKEDLTIKQEAIKSLENMGELAITPLTKSLRYGEWEERMYAAQALGNIGDNRATEQLTRSLDDKNSLVKEQVVLALEKIEPKQEINNVVEDIADEIGDTKPATLFDVVNDFSITPEIEQWYNGLGEGFLRANFPTLDEGQLKVLVDSDDRVQTLRDLDFSDNELMLRMGGKGVSVDDKNNQISLLELNLESEISKTGIDVNQINLMQQNSRGVMTLYQYLQALKSGEAESQGVSLGLTGSPYTELSLLGSHWNWIDAYRSWFQLSTDEKTEEFMQELVKREEEVVFFVPSNIFTHSEAGATARELEWLLNNPQGMKNVHFVVGGYDSSIEGYFQNLGEMDVIGNEDEIIDEILNAKLLPIYDLEVSETASLRVAHLYGVDTKSISDTVLEFKKSLSQLNYNELSRANKLFESLALKWEKEFPIENEKLKSLWVIFVVKNHEEKELAKKAAIVLNRKITERETKALRKAHLIGFENGRVLGPIKEDGTYEKSTINPYSELELLQKARILELAWFDIDERRKLIEHGVVGAEG